MTELQFFAGHHQKIPFDSSPSSAHLLFASAQSIIKPNRNVWKTAHSEKIAFLIDGANYFKALDKALRQAQHEIWIVGWDFNPDIVLCPDEGTQTMRELLLSLVNDNPWLQVHILVWSMGPVYSGKSLRLFRESEFSSHPQITMKFDSKHPLRACHHQKLVCIDNNVGFLGGIDLTARRWDDQNHAAENPLRVAPDGKPYDPVHDIQVMVSGEAARLIGDVARRRWHKATGETVEPSFDSKDIWPDSIEPAIRDSQIGVALTEPGLINRRGRHEAVRLTHDAIRAARHHIYIEAEYLASFKVSRTLAKRLKETDGPEVVVIVTKSSHGFLEKLAMGNNRDRIIRKLKHVDHHNRLRIFYPVVPDPKGEDKEINVHAKLIIIDDQFVRIGSSNLNNRSEGLDTECDLAIEATRQDHAIAIGALRDTLIAEHVDSEPAIVHELMQSTHSLVAVFDQLNTKPRGLRSFDVDLSKGETSPITGTVIVDPPRPYWMFKKLRLLAGGMKARLASIF